MTRCLAFDLGASGGKFIVGGFDGKSLEACEAHRFENSMVGIGPSLYWDYRMIWGQYLEGIRKALARFPGLSSVAADSFCNDFLLVNADGDPLGPMHAYRDPRMRKNEDAIYGIMSRRELYSISGNQIAPFSTLMQLAAMRLEGRGGLIDDADSLLFLPDLLTYYLTGARHAERSIASVTQMYDHGAKGWSGEALGRFGIERRVFAPFIDAGSIAGMAAAGIQSSIGAARPLRVCAVAQHDTASAFAASLADGDTLVVSSGTWMLVGCEVEAPVITDYGFRYNIANEGGLDGHHRLIKNLMGNWILQEIRRESPGGSAEWDYGALAAAAGRLPLYKWLFDVDLPCFYEPGGMREKVRSVCMQAYGSAPETPAEFMASVCASLAFKTRWAMEKLEALTGLRFSRINIIGGGSRDLYTARLVADACGLPVFCGPAEASALGNILYQLIASGELSDIGEGREIVEKGTLFTHVEPGASGSADSADEAYARFIDAFGL